MIRAGIYLRVSTSRQAEKDLSIPDQRRHLEAWCRQNGFEVVAEYVEPGASAMDDRRPQFQRMMDDATRPDRLCCNLLRGGMGRREVSSARA